MAKRKFDEEISEEVVKETKTGIVKVLSNFRSEANSDCKIISTLDAGTIVEVLDEPKKNGFFKIRMNKKEGYLREDLIDLK